MCELAFRNIFVDLYELLELNFSDFDPQILHQ